jgi:hypothetical protein
MVHNGKNLGVGEVKWGLAALVDDEYAETTKTQTNTDYCW